MMRHSPAAVLSVGDAVRPGRFRPHSAFGSAANFVGRGRLVSLVTTKVGPGPGSVVLAGPLPVAAGPLVVEKTGFRLGGRFQSWRGSAVYGSSLNPASLGRVSLSRLRRRGLCLADSLRGTAPGSLTFLFEPAGTADEGSRFQRELRRRVRRACDLIFHGGKLAAGARMMRGAGAGFTPAGDDFLCGVLAGCDVLERASGDSLRERKELLYRNALSRDPLANACLRFAREGRYHHRHKRLLESLLGEDGEAVLAAAREVASVGATSGADWLTGLALSLGASRR